MLVLEEHSTFFSISHLDFAITPSLTGSYSWWKKSQNKKIDFSESKFLLYSSKIISESFQETEKSKAKVFFVGTYLKFLDKLFGIRGRDKDMSLRWFDKAIINGFINESEEVIVVTIHI